MKRSSNPRRQTLGPVSVNASGDKVSLRESGTGVPSSVSKARPPTGRASMIPRVGRENLVPPTPPSASVRQTNSASRRTSVGPDRRQSLLPPTATSKVDPRQIGEKGFQQNCIKKLLKHLVDHGYDHPITHKSLARPSGKDFNHIVTFMFRQIDSNFQDGTMKIEDEIALGFKALGYPFPVSKTSLVAAGSPHAWPSLLAALTWLTERIQCFQSVTNVVEESSTFGSLEELEIKTDKAFFRYLSASYSAFLRDDEKATEELEVALAEHFEKDDEIIEKEIEQMTDKNAVILEQINNLTMGEEDLQEYQKKRDGYKTDLAQFHDLINQMDNHVKMLHQKKIDRSTELNESNSKLSTTNAIIVQLKNSIRCQELNVEAARSLQTVFKGVCESIERAQCSNENKRILVNQSSVEQQALWHRIEELVSIYNAGISDLSPFVPRSTFELAQVNVGSTTVSSGPYNLGHDLEEMVKGTLASLKRDLAGALSSSKNDYQQRLDELGKCEGKFAEAREHLKIIADKTSSRESTLEEERDVMKAKCGVRLREAESFETKISSLRDPVALEERMAHYERQCAELELLRSKNQESRNILIRNIFAEIENACSAMDQFEIFLASKADEIQKYRSVIHSSYEDLECFGSSVST